MISFLAPVVMISMMIGGENKINEERPHQIFKSGWDAKIKRVLGSSRKKRVASELTTTTNKSEEFVRGNKNEAEDE